jgi:hypothetical protein
MAAYRARRLDFSAFFVDAAVCGEANSSPVINTAVPRGGVFLSACDPPTEFFDSLTLIVGQDKDSPSPVRGSDLRR